MALGKKGSALGKNPLSPSTSSQSIFTKTTEDTSEVKPTLRKASSKSRIKNQESRFLESEEKEKVNLRLPIEVNDWLDDLVKQGKRLHGSKIPKEIWVQAALELFKAMPLDWQDIDSPKTLQAQLKTLESRLKNQDS
ncbi:hypothetical protein [Picosynechococcus sp. PCC 8807]|uniref:hypothetical protein n=1 Tax=Picosynechococcus sp. PCC 8807 TaxID=195248 RepID=UPI000810AE19|nr:hypothetical protein [Picosynechococcus sp. PCC 8807]ANV92072.1 hypothetical protein AWQ24_14935 [Picosynechococcus sp. PCC 8807]